MTTNQTPVYSNHPLPPGRILRREIEHRDISRQALADQMGCSIELVNDIISGAASVTPDIAADIQSALGIKAYLWLNLETTYRATLAHNELVTRQGPNHTCDLGPTCPSRIATTHDQDETYDEETTSANILMDEGEDASA